MKSAVIRDQIVRLSARKQALEKFREQNQKYEGGELLSSHQLARLFYNDTTTDLQVFEQQLKDREAVIRLEAQANIA